MVNSDSDDDVDDNDFEGSSDAEGEDEPVSSCAVDMVRSESSWRQFGRDTPYYSCRVTTGLLPRP